MPTKEQHIEQANHDDQFWNSLNPGNTQYIDWVVCVIFYEAVHWIEAFLATKGLHPRTHVTRQVSMLHYSYELGPILDDFKYLKNDSENARYRCYKHPLSDVQSYIIPRIINIREHIKPKL